MVSSSVVFGLSLLLLAQDVAAGNGIIGFGLSLYQDSCCLACHDSLASLYLNCTTFPEHDDMSGMDDGMDMEAMPMTSDECRTSNKPWLQSMAYCIKQACTPDGYTERRQAACFNTHALSGASGPSYHQSLPATAPTVELPEDATWLNATSLVNSHLYHTTHGTLDEFSRSEYIHTRYSVILYFIVIGTCLLWGLKTQLATLFPGASRPSSLTSKLRQYLYLPAFLGSRHLEPLPGNLGYMPSRALGASIGIYIILNIVFSSISFGSFQPNIYWPTMRVELCEYVGNRTGMLSLVNMSIAILFAGRNNILIAITGWSQTTFMTLHRWAARVATLQAIVHSAAYTLQYTDPGYEGATSYAKEVAEPFYWWGIIGTIALSLATAFAVLPLRISYYEFFLITHIVLIILSLVACWYHLVPHFGFKYGYQVWLYICFAFWSADRLARAVRVLYYNRLGNTKAIVEAIPGCNILHVTVFPRVTRGIGPGQHTFLYFPGLGKFWESHPFSIAAWQTQTHHTSSSSVQLTSSSSVSASEGGNTSGASKRDSLHHVKLTATPHHQEAIVTRDVQKPQNDASFQLLIRAHSGMTGALQRYLSAPSNADSK
ncbi:ferric reductase like transmembrane component-domain-containing protein, partial [Astrocystis sublimbata]